MESIVCSEDDFDKAAILAAEIHVAALEKECQSLKDENAALRAEREPRAPQDSAEVQRLQSEKREAEQSSEALKEQLAEKQKQVDDGLKDLIAEQDRCAKLREELRNRDEDLHRLGHEKWQAAQESRSKQFALETAQKDIERLVEEKREAERRAQDVESTSAERDKLRREKTTLRLELEKQIEDAKAEASFFKNAVAEARNNQDRLLRQQEAAFQDYEERMRAAAVHRATLEAKLASTSEQLRHEGDLRESTQKQLAEMTHERDASEVAGLAAVADTDRLRVRVSELEETLRKTSSDYEELLRQRIPGAMASTEAPEGFASLADLVGEVSASREQLLHERQAKEEAQAILRQVEQEVKTQYPVLLGHRDKSERRDRLNAELRRHNEGLLARVQDLEEERKQAEVQKRKAERSVMILETHCRDTTKQIAVLVHENRLLKGGPDSAYSRAASAAEKYEAEKSCFRNVEELAEKNEQLRRQLVQLSEESEQMVLKLKESGKKQQEQWKKHLSAKSEQMKELTETVARLGRERDEAVRKAETAADATSQVASVERPAKKARVDEQDAKLAAQAAAREAKLSAQIEEARNAEMKSRLELANAKGSLETMTERLRLANEKLEEKFQESRQQQLCLERERKVFEERLREQGIAATKCEAALDKQRRDTTEFERQLQSERLRATTLEKDHAALLKDQAALHQKVKDKEESCNEESRKLNAVFEAMREQLKASSVRCDELQMAANKSQVKVEECLSQVADLSSANARLEAEINRLQGSYPGYRSLQTEGDADASVEIVEVEMSPAEGTSSQNQDHKQHYAQIMKQQLEKINELVEEKNKLAELSESLERDLAHQAELQSTHKEEADKVRQEKRDLEALVKSLEADKAGLQKAVDDKGAEVQEVRHLSEDKLSEANAALAANAREQEQDRKRIEDLEALQSTSLEKLARLVAQSEELRRRCEQVEKERDFKERASGQWQSECEELKKTKNALHQRLLEAEGAYQIATAENEALTDKLKSSQAMRS